MALELSIQKTAVTSSGDVMTVSDITGDYNASTNTGGYGAPNESRSNLALFLTVSNKRIDTDVPLFVEGNDVPEDVTKWDVTLNLDGWNESTIHGLLRLDDSNDLAVGELTYDFASNEIREVLTKMGASSPWTYTTQLVNETALLDDSKTVAHRTVEDFYDLTQLNQCNFKSNKRFYETKELNDKDKYIEIRSSIVAINYQFNLNNPSKAQEMVESLEPVCTCFSEDSCIL